MALEGNYWGRTNFGRLYFPSWRPHRRNFGPQHGPVGRSPSVDILWEECSEVHWLLWQHSIHQINGADVPWRGTRTRPHCNLYIFQSSLLPCRRQSCSTWSCWLDGRWALVCCSHAYQVQTLLAPNQWHIRIAKHATSAGRMTSLIVAQSSRNLANNMYAQLRKYSLRATKPKQYDISSTQDQSSESDTHSFDGTWGAHMQWSWCNCTWRERSLLYISCTHSSIWISFLPILESLVVSAILCELLL